MAGDDSLVIDPSPHFVLVDGLISLCGAVERCYRMVLCVFGLVEPKELV